MGNAGSQESNTAELIKLLALLQQGDAAGGGGKAGGKTKSGGGLGGLLGNK